VTIHIDSFYVRTRGRGMVDITGEVQRIVQVSGVESGLCTVFIHHTSASLLVSENADPAVQRDLEAFFERLVPDGDPLFEHTAEGADDMPSHVRAALTQTSIGLPVNRSRCDLGTWQGVYCFEHRLAGHKRRVSVTIIG
jgi:secondary thiamine-phosphate synthase enzyme